MPALIPAVAGAAASYGAGVALTSAFGATFASSFAGTLIASGVGFLASNVTSSALPSNPKERIA